MKYAIFAGTLLTCSTIAIAAPQTNTMAMNNGFTGAYANLSLGARIASGKFEYKLKDTAGDIDNTDPATNASVTNTQFTEVARLGYGKQFQNNLYVGANFSFALAQGKKAFNNRITDAADVNSFDSIDSSLQYKHAYSANVDLGYAINNTYLPYLELGYKWTEATLTHNDSITNSGTLRRVGGGSTTINYNGFTVGAGLNYKITAHWLVNGLVDVTFYNNKTANAATVLTRAGTNSTTTLNYQLTSNPSLSTTATVGVSYLF